MSASVNFASTPRVGMGRLTTGSASPSVPTNVVLIFDPGASGARIHRVDVNAVATTTAATTVFLYLSTNATNYYMIASIRVDAVTVAAGTPPFSGSIFYPEGLPLPVGCKLYATVTTTDSLDVVAHGGDF